MVPKRTLLLVIAIAVMAFVVYMAYQVFFVVNHLPEAYAAWDTGTLLVEYMDTSGGEWPSSWEDLIGLVRDDTNKRIPLRGARAGDVAYASGLQQIVRVQWSASPSADESFSPVTCIDRTEFPVLWEGADPNEMVREYMKNLTTKN